MIYLKKRWSLYVLIGCLGWVSSASAEDPTGRQNRIASAATSASAPVKAATATSNKDGVCTKCHDENEIKPILSIYQTKHGVKADLRTPTCQSCHGESNSHLHGDVNQKGRAAPDILFGNKKSTSASYAPSETAAQNDACLSCHSSEAERMYWEGSAHQSRDVACVSCHEIHTAHNKTRERETQIEICFSCHKEQRAQSHRAFVHPVQSGKMGCSSCHNPHGSSGPKLLHQDTVNETCWTCHAEKRGPFLWEHAPVTDNCSNCHTPHGSNNTAMLTTRTPYICASCHIGGGHSTTSNRSGFDLGGDVVPNGQRVGAFPPAGGPALVTGGGALPGSTSAAPQMVGKACLNCHTQIHGSNHPSGARFVR